MVCMEHWHSFNERVYGSWCHLKIMIVQPRVNLLNHSTSRPVRMVSTYVLLNAMALVIFCNGVASGHKGSLPATVRRRTPEIDLEVGWSGADVEVGYNEESGGVEDSV